MNCLICQQKMKFVKNITKIKGRTNEYNMKRYKCSICEYEENVLADEEQYEHYVNIQANSDVRRYFKQQEQNQL